MLDKKVRDRLTVLTAALIFFGTFVTIAILDKPHQEFGDSFLPEDINSRIIMDQGHFQDPSIPEGLLILGKGRPAVLKFEVFNLDPDNDIDTIEVKIPEAQIGDAEYEWYLDTAEHEWSYSGKGTDTITFEAQDDFTGQAGGENPYYDTAGNIDDALDFIEDYDDGDNPIFDLSEGITLTVPFNAPSQSGMKMGVGSIDLKVGDLKTEDPGAPLTSFDPYPYPYINAWNGDVYLIIVLKTPTCDLEVDYGGVTLFSPTRGDDFKTSQYGFEYKTDAGETVAVLSDPGDKVVVPLVKAGEDGLSGNFVLDMYKITITDIQLGTIQKTVIASDYQDEVPSTMEVVVDNDLDRDGEFNNIDDDMDGDGIPNTQDSFPKIYNRLPVILGKTANLTVSEGEDFSLTVDASDPDQEVLTYTWTNDQDLTWTSTGKRVDLSDLAPGDYVFTVTIADELGNSRSVSISVKVDFYLSPFISSLTPSKEKVKPGGEVTLSVEALDPENGTLTYTWTHDQDPDWRMTGNPITVRNLQKGTYIFTVTVSDGYSNETYTRQIDVKDEEAGSSLLLILIIVIVIVLIIVIVAVLLLMKRKKKGTPVPAEVGSEGAYDMGYGGGEVSHEESYEGFYDPNDSDMNVGSYSPDAPLEVYPDQPEGVVEMTPHQDAQVMEYPEGPTSGGFQEQVPEEPKVEETAAYLEPEATEVIEGELPPEPTVPIEPAPSAPGMPPPPPPPPPSVPKPANVQDQ
ncbi:MAG: PKD domain-containing protein [Thermoplasmatota archaeon]